MSLVELGVKLDVEKPPGVATRGGGWSLWKTGDLSVGNNVGKIREGQLGWERSAIDVVNGGCQRMLHVVLLADRADISVVLDNR